MAERVSKIERMGRYPADGNLVRRFFFGLAAPFRGARFLLAHRALWGWSFALAAISLGAFVLIASQFVPLSARALQHVWAEPDGGWLVPLWSVARVLFGVVFVAASYLAALIVSRVVAAPLYDKLSEGVERRVSPTEDEPSSWRQLLADSAQGVRHTLANLALSLLVGLGIALLSSLSGPAAPIVGGALGGAWSVTVAALEFTDFSMSRRRLAYRAKWRFARAHLPTFVGLGAGTYALLAVPLLNLLAMPVAVVGGTLVFLAVEREAEASRMQAPGAHPC